MLFLRIFTTLLLLGGGFVLWAFGMLVIAFDFIKQTAMGIVWTLLLLAGATALL